MQTGRHSILKYIIELQMLMNATV